MSLLCNLGFVAALIASPEPAASALPPVASLQAMLDERVTQAGTGIIVAEIGPAGVTTFEAGASGIGRPIDGHSIFDIASVTKTMTATLLATMVLDGTVKLDDPLASYLPKTVHVPERNGKEITLLSLATQRSGLPVLPNDPTVYEVGNPFSPTLDDTYAFLSHYTLPRDPDTETVYSNLGIGLLGQALANRENTTFGELLETRVLGPLGMNDTTLVLTPDQAARRPIGRNPDGKLSTDFTFNALAPAGDVHSSIDDMLKYARCNMGQGPLANACLFAQRRRDPIGPHSDIGLAWWIEDKDGIVHHPGTYPGYHAAIAISADHTEATVVLANGGIPVDDLALHTLDASLPVAMASPPPKP